jgi:FAD/FMN-containing dehydrogenase
MVLPTQVTPSRLVTAGDAGWDAARQSFNVLVDQQPDAVAQPADAGEVVAAVMHARRNGLRIVPQTTGHNAGPLGALDGALIVNTSRLDEVSIDVANRSVRVGAGVRWESVAGPLSQHGLAALHGSSPDVGIAGYSLGGGIGWLARKHGMQTNSVTAIEIVTADGTLLRTDAHHEPDLFWALRGGNGNFGVVTALEFDVYEAPQLYAGTMFFPFERAHEVLNTWDAMLPTLPEETMTWVSLLHFPPLPEVPENLRGGSYVIVFAVHQGSEDEGREVLAPLHDLGPAFDTLGMVAPAALGDLAMDPRDPLPVASTHHLLGELPVDEFLGAVGPGSGIGPALTMVQLRHMGGALGRVAPGAGARATLPGEVCVFGLGVIAVPELAAPVQGALRALDAALAPHRVGDYPNFVEEPADARAFFDAATWSRLRAVKAAYDPDDAFKGNHHIPPAV